MNRLFLKPGQPGLIVRDPRSKQPLPEAGAYKPVTTYWIKRIASGDAVEAEPPEPAVELAVEQPEGPPVVTAVTALPEGDEQATRPLRARRTEE